MGALRTPVPRVPSRPEVEVDEGALELSDVPAAVVCASCGSPECLGCELDRPSAFSGVVAVVPWERPGGSLAARLWATAKLSALSPDELFASLPPGGVAAPLGFAVLAELLAALGLCATFALGALALVPAFGDVIWGSVPLQQLLLRIVLFGSPLLAALMVLLHSAHGLALDAAARRAGSSRAGRGLRFGLYSCGWDLVTLPLGLLLLAFTDGVGAALRCAPRGLTAPRRAAVAYLVHVHHFEAARAPEVSQRAIAIVAGPMVVLLVAVLALGLLVTGR